MLNHGEMNERSTIKERVSKYNSFRQLFEHRKGNGRQKRNTNYSKYFESSEDDYDDEEEESEPDVTEEQNLSRAERAKLR